MGWLTVLDESFYPRSLNVPLDTSSSSIRAARVSAWAAQLAYEVDDEAKTRRVVERWGRQDLRIIRGLLASHLPLVSNKGFAAHVPGDCTVIVFAGTEPTSKLNWITDLSIHCTAEGVHSGFLVTAQVSPAGSGEPEVCDQVVGVASQRLEEIPPLLLGCRDQRTDHGEVAGTGHRSEAAGDFLPQLHHSPVLLPLIVREWHSGICEETEHVLLAGGKAQQQVVADPSWRRSAAPGRCGGQSGLCLMERDALRDNAVVTSHDHCDPRRPQRHIPLARKVGRVTGEAQQALHLACPLFALDLDQRFQLAQMVRVMPMSA